MTNSVSKATDEDGAEWNSFIATSETRHHAYRWEWKSILERTFGHVSHYLISRSEGKLTGVLPLFEVNSLLFGKSLVSVPYLNAGGIIASTDEAHAALLSAAEKISTEKGSRYLELRAREKNSRYVAQNGSELPVRTHKVAMIRELMSDPEKLFASFPAKLRSQIRRPTKAGLYAEVTEPTHAALSAFYAIFAANMRDLGTPVYPRKLFEFTAQSFAKQSRIILVYKDGNSVAAGFTIGEGNHAEIPWASSLRAYNKDSPNMLLYWEALKQACIDGYQKFDFGRSSRESGTFRFKEQWGAIPQDLFWYYVASPENVPDVNPNNPRFEFFVRCWKHLPLFVANNLGPFLTRSLP